MNIKEVIQKELDLPAGYVDDALKLARIRVKRFTIPKRKDGYRVIYQPSKKLKTIQYWLIHNVFNKLNIHEAAAAYRNNTSILTNAEKHINSKYFLKTDLIDFFPSINYSDLEPIILEWHKKSKPDWVLDESALALINLSCFYKENILPIGYPSSPIISNIVMFDFDTKISRSILNKSKFGKVIYTRYADDLIISTDKSDCCNELLQVISNIIKTTKSPNISLNNKKTKTSSRTAGSAMVTGLRICEDKHITIHKKQKDHIRLLLSLFRKNSLKEDDYKSLQGHISYIRHVDPTFYSKIQKKYFMEITKLDEISK